MGVENKPPPPLGYEGEIPFDDKAWAEARDIFLTNRHAQSKHSDTEQALQEFLHTSCSPSDARNFCASAKKTVSTRYSPSLGGILSKIDLFMKVGDLAIKSAPESVGIAWAGIRMCLHSVQDDFATFSAFSDACGDMIGILISCTVYGGMYGKSQGVPELEEIHSRVVSFIPGIYADMLDFNYSMMKHTKQNKLISVALGMYKSAAQKYKDKFASLKSNEQKMRDFAKTAGEQLMKYYQEMGLQNDEKLLRVQLDMLGDLQEIKEDLQDVKQTLKEMSKQTPFAIATRTFENNSKRLEPSVDHQTDFWKENVKHREPDTCRWIFQEKEYDEWKTSENSSLLWVSGEGGFGKSFLIGSIIESLKNSELQDDSMAIHYFFCKDGDDSTQKSEKIKRTLLYQLYALAENQPDILEEANRLMGGYLGNPKGDKKDDSKAKTSKDKATKTFVETYQDLAHLMNKTIFLIVDALDEIVDREDEEFLKDLRRIPESATKPIKMKILFCSRPKTDIISELEGFTEIKVAGHNEDDIRRNVTSLLGKLSGFSAAERTLACNDIVAKAGGEFRYVQMAMDFLRVPWSRPLEKRLEKLQKGLLNSYEQALQQTDPNYQDFLKTCLTWTLLAEGNVTVGEVMDAFSCTYGEGQEEQDIEDVEGDKLPRKQVEKAGGTFLEVNPHTDVIKPRHATVTEYFLDHAIHEGDHPVIKENDVCVICRREKLTKSRPFVVTRKDGHLEIACTILQNLSSPAFWRKHYSGSFWEEFFATGDHAVDDKSESNSDVGDGSGTDPQDSTPATSVGAKDENSETIVNDGKASKDTYGNGEAVIMTTSGVNGMPVNTAEVNGVKKSDLKAENVDAENVAENAPVPEIPPISLTQTDGTVISDINNENSATKIEAAVLEASKAEQENDPTNTNSLAPPEEDSDDAVSEADSDIHPEEVEWKIDDNGLPDKRYEVSHCIYHLRKVEETWPEESRTDPQFERFRNLLRTFFRKDSPQFKKWIKIQGNTLDSTFYYEETTDVHPLEVGASYGLSELMRVSLEPIDGKEVDKVRLDDALLSASYYYFLDDPLPFQMLLDRGADPNSFDENSTPFQQLLRRNHRFNVVKLFLEKGAKADYKNKGGSSAMWYFAQGGDDEDIEVLKTLLDKGADINVIDEWGETPLHELVRRWPDPPLKLLKEFVAQGANVNFDDKEQQRPLYEVSWRGSVEAATILLTAGADVNHADAHGQTALHIAAQEGHQKLCQVLLEHGADITKLDEKNRSSFWLACGSKSTETALFLATQLKEEHISIFSQKSTAGKSPLTKAAARGHTEVVKMILNKIDLSTEIDQQDTRVGHTPLHIAALNGSKDIVELLLQNGARTDITDKKGSTPFASCVKHWTQIASNDLATVLVMLIDREPLLTVQNPDLMFAAALKGNVPILTKLLDKGSSLSALDEHGWTPLQVAAQYGHGDAVKLLTDRGAIVGRRPTAWSCPLDTVKVSEDGLSVEYVAEAGSETGVLSNHPIPAGTKRYYFELSVSEPGGVKSDPGPVNGWAIGVCNRPARISSWMPGWLNETSGGAPSWGYHGDDGGLYSESKSSLLIERGKFGTWGHEEVIGCGVDFEKGEIFYTKGGVKLGTAFKDIRGRLHPIVGLGAPATVKVNFGADLVKEPFKWEKANTTLDGWVD